MAVAGRKWVGTEVLLGSSCVGSVLSGAGEGNEEVKGRGKTEG